MTTNNSKKKVYLMLSGGVDSSVAASILKDQGYQVKGIYMKCWSLEQLDKLEVSRDLYACNWEDDILDASAVAKKLEINFEVWDLQQEYLEYVVNYMLLEYQKGRTPNPDVMCNSNIKFGVFYQKAIQEGAEYVASGHYARTTNLQNILALSEYKALAAGIDNQTQATRVILRGIDPLKDQAYFLWRIGKTQIPQILLPIGEFKSKQMVREYALKKGLITAEKKDSQGLCFIGKTSLRDLLLEKLGSQEGLIVTKHLPKTYKLDKKLQKQLPPDLKNLFVLGLHQAAHTYTIGQREKLGLNGGPWFVSQIDIPKNLVYVTHVEDKKVLEANRLIIKDLNWQAPLELILIITKHNLLSAQIRYHGEIHACIIKTIDSQDKEEMSQPEELKNFEQLQKNVAYEIYFPKAVQAPAKGQSVVFYCQDIMLGGGVIDRVLENEQVFPINLTK